MTAQTITATAPAARIAVEQTAARVSSYTGERVYLDVEFFAGAELDGRALVVVTYRRPESEHRARLLVTVVGDKVEGHYSAPSTDAAVAAKKLARDLDTAADDVRILPQLVSLVRNATLADELTATEAAPAVGDVAYVFAMGYLRRGVVTKLTKTKATVAYTTASSGGRVFRKAAPFAELRFDAAPAAAPAPATVAANVPAACPVVECAEGEAHVAGSNVCTSTPAELTEAEHRAELGFDAVEEGAAFDADLDAQQAADDEERARELEEELADLARAGVTPGRIAELREDSTAEERAAERDAAYRASREEPAPAAPGDLITVTLTRPLTVHVDDDTAPELLPAGTAIGVASTDTDTVLTVLVVDPAGRQHVAGEAARVEVEAALRPAPAPKGPRRVDASTFTPRPVHNLGGRLRSIAARAERFGSFRDDAEALVAELKASGRPSHIELGRQLEAALGRRGAARGGAGLNLDALKRLAH